MENNVDNIVRGLESFYKQEINDIYDVIKKEAEHRVSFDERVIATEKLKEDYLFLEDHLQHFIDDLVYKEVSKIREEIDLTQNWLGYEKERIIKGKVAHLIETGEIAAYSFEELASLVRPFDYTKANEFVKQVKLKNNE